MPLKSNGPPRTDSDGKALYPGEQSIWRQIVKAVGADSMKRKGTRRETNKRTKKEASSSKKKNPALEKEEEKDLETTLTSSLDERQLNISMDDTYEANVEED